MNYDIVEVVIDRTIRTFRLREWQYDIEDIVEDIAEALKHIGAAKIYAELIATVTVTNKIAKIPRDCQNIKYVDTPNQYYRESGNFIEIDLADDTEVDIYYQAMPVDTRGYPLVPDNVAVRDAIMWFLAKVLILQKEITHVPFAQAEAEWQWRCGSARASLTSLNLQQVNRMYQDWVRLNPLKDVHENNYTQLGKGNTLDRERHTEYYRDSANR